MDKTHSLLNLRELSPDPNICPCAARVDGLTRPSSSPSSESDAPEVSRSATTTTAPDRLKMGFAKSRTIQSDTLARIDDVWLWMVSSGR